MHFRSGPRGTKLELCTLLGAPGRSGAWTGVRFWSKCLSLGVFRRNFARNGRKTGRHGAMPRPPRVHKSLFVPRRSNPECITRVLYHLSRFCSGHDTLLPAPRFHTAPSVQPWWGCARLCKGLRTLRQSAVQYPCESRAARRRSSTDEPQPPYGRASCERRAASRLARLKGRSRARGMGIRAHATRNV